MLDPDDCRWIADHLILADDLPAVDHRANAEINPGRWPPLRYPPAVLAGFIFIAVTMLCTCLAGRLFS